MGPRARVRFNRRTPVVGCGVLPVINGGIRSH